MLEVTTSLTRPRKWLNYAQHGIWLQTNGHPAATTCLSPGFGTKTNLILLWIDVNLFRFLTTIVESGPEVFNYLLGFLVGNKFLQINANKWRYSKKKSNENDPCSKVASIYRGLIGRLTRLCDPPKYSTSWWTSTRRADRQIMQGLTGQEHPRADAQLLERFYSLSAQLSSDTFMYSSPHYLLYMNCCNSPSPLYSLWQTKDEIFIYYFAFSPLGKESCRSKYYSNVVPLPPPVHFL